MKTTYLYKMEDDNLATIYLREGRRLHKDMEIKFTDLLCQSYPEEVMDNIINALNGVISEPNVVCHPKAVEKVVGWTAMDKDGGPYGGPRCIATKYAWETADMVRERWPDHRIVRLIEEPSE